MFRIFNAVLGDCQALDSTDSLSECTGPWFRSLAEGAWKSSLERERTPFGIDKMRWEEERSVV